MECVCSVSLSKTKPQRSVCGRSGALCNVNGLLCGVDLVVCWFHRRQLQRLGLKVEKVIPLGQRAARAEQQRKSGLRSVPKPMAPESSTLPPAA